MHPDSEFDWKTIGALNAVSAMAQVGQFGIAFVILPVWLADQGLDAAQLGMFAASLWLGQLPGLGWAPRLCQRFGEAWVIASGLLCTVLALLWIALVGWPWWLGGGLLAGFGLGLRWIGLEPWLYRIAPAHARGRLVGFHETLIALAPIVAPLLVTVFGLHGQAPFWIGTAFTVGALVPLSFARQPVVDKTARTAHSDWKDRLSATRVPVFRQGIAIALLGGMMESAVSGLFALFTQSQGMAIDQTAELLAVFGVGGLLMQYGVGWLADHRSLRLAALVCAAGTALVCVALAIPMRYAFLVVWVFLLGGFITSFLTLSIIAATMSTAGSMASNVSSISMLYTVSAVVGPLLAGAWISASNGLALMWFTAAAAASLVWLLGGRSRWRPRPGRDAAG